MAQKRRKIGLRLSVALLLALSAASWHAHGAKASAAEPEPSPTLPACHYMPPDDGQPIQVAATVKTAASATDVGADKAKANKADSEGGSSVLKSGVGAAGAVSALVLIAAAAAVYRRKRRT